MCGRIFCLFESTEELISAVNHELGSDKSVKTSLKTNEIAPRFNIAPTTNIPVISEDNRLILLPWGFKLGPISVINARNEEIENKKSFKNLVNSERCVILCSGYYEWDQKDPKHKKPYSFRLKHYKICFIAALRNPESDSVVLITREAVDSISKIHTRMPVILRPNHIEKWLNTKLYSFQSLESLIIGKEKYLGDFEIESQAVNPIVNNARNETSLCLQDYAEYREEGKNSFFANRKKPKLDQ